MNKKHIQILAYLMFGLFILANILFFATDICYACEMKMEKEIKTISLEEWKSKINEEVIILDVRTKGEFEQGNIENSINIDFLSQNFKEELSKLDKEVVYLIYCRSGSRSGQALSIFEELNFTRVYNLEGGILNYK